MTVDKFKKYRKKQWKKTNKQNKQIRKMKIFPINGQYNKKENNARQRFPISEVRRVTDLGRWRWQGKKSKNKSIKNVGNKLNNIK